ncbi:MAG: hypothetical protein WB626_03370 [Bacteroidota bacterium]
MKHTFFFAVFALAAALVLGVAGCDTSDETVTPPTTTIAGPTNFRAYSAGDSSVGLSWTASVDESKTEVLNPAYTVRAKDTSGTLVRTQTAVKGISEITVTGLTGGTIYDFVIRMNVASGAVSNDSLVIRWSPARRRDTELGAPIQVFETASPTFPSGLDIFSNSSNGPVTLSMTGVSNSQIDVFVFTDPGSSDLLIRSASLSTVIPTPRTTFFSTVSRNAETLNDPQATPPDPATYSTLVVTVPAAAATTGKIFYGKTQDNNYFRLLVTRSGASLISGTSPDRFITVKVSYQGEAGNPYAMRNGGWILTGEAE